MVKNLKHSLSDTPIGIAITSIFLMFGCGNEPVTQSAPLKKTPIASSGRFQKTSGRRPRYPTRIATSEDGTIFVSDVRQNRVFGVKDNEVVFEISGLDDPIGIAVRDNSLFVGNRGRGSVEVYDLERRTYIRSLGRGEGEFGVPNDIALDAGGMVYVVDSLENTVKVYDDEGSFIKKIGDRGRENGEFVFPSSIDVDSVRLVVGDQGNHRVQVFGLDGEWIFSFGESATESCATMDQMAGKFTRIQGVALASKSIYVLDSYHSHVQEFDLTGKSRRFIGTRGHCATCIALGLDVAVDKDGELLVADPEHERWLSLDKDTGRAP